MYLELYFKNCSFLLWLVSGLESADLSLLLCLTLRTVKFGDCAVRTCWLYGCLLAPVSSVSVSVGVMGNLVIENQNIISPFPPRVLDCTVVSSLRKVI